MLDDNESDSKLLAVNTEEPGFDINSLEMLTNTYPGLIDIIKLWLIHYKGPGKIKILSVKDEKDAIRYLNSAHIAYIDQKNK